MQLDTCNCEATAQGSCGCTAAAGAEAGTMSMARMQKHGDTAARPKLRWVRGPFLHATPWQVGRCQVALCEVRRGAEHERPVVNRMVGLTVFADLVSLAEHEFATMSVEERDKLKKPEYTMNEAEIYVEARLKHMREAFAEALKEAEYRADEYERRFNAVREAVEKA